MKSGISRESPNPQRALVMDVAVCRDSGVNPGAPQGLRGALDQLWQGWEAAPCYVPNPDLPSCIAGVRELNGLEKALEKGCQCKAVY